MDPPSVYIEREPFLNMILASIETFDRECLGEIYGKPLSRASNCFHISNAIAIQLAKKRKNSEIEQSKASKKRMGDIHGQYPNLYPKIGDFHSHPEWRGRHRLAEMSPTDIEDMKRNKEDLKVCIVIKISHINKERIIWESASDGGIRGSLGEYKFHVNAFRLDQNDEQEILEIQAPAAMRSLNSAIGYT